MQPWESSLVPFYFGFLYLNWASQVALVVKNPPDNAGDIRDMGSIPGLGKSPGGGAWQPSPVFLPGESHEEKSLVGYSTESKKSIVQRVRHD